MDLHTEMILDEYKENLETFNIIKRVVLEHLNQYVKDFGSIVNSVEARIKTEKSLRGKLELKGDKYTSLEDITDIVGARLLPSITTKLINSLLRLKEVLMSTGKILLIKEKFIR